MITRTKLCLLLTCGLVLVTKNTVAGKDNDEAVVNIPSTDYQGNEIINAALTNATINGHLQHLAVHSLEVQSGRSNLAGGTRMAAIDHRGGLSTIPQVKWDGAKDSLQIPGLSSASDPIAVHADIDLQSNTLRNFHLEPNSVLSNVIFEHGTIRDANLANVSFENLKLGDIAVDQIQISSIRNNDPETSTFLIIGDDGFAKSSDTILETQEGIVVKKDVRFEVPLNLEEQVKAKEIETHTLRLTPYHQSKRHFTDALARIDSDGVLRSTDITLEDGGWIEHAKFRGNIHFRSDPDADTRHQGRIINALIQGGSINEVEQLSVAGKVNVKGELRVEEDAFIDGGLSVGGSVLGSGPYVDVSDKRLKKNINLISKDDVMDKLKHLQAVSYDLKKDADDFTKSRTGSEQVRQQIGFIAQEVQEVFPELVSTRPDGYLGVQYSRFVPLMIEALKDMDARIRQIEEKGCSGV